MPFNAYFLNKTANKKAQVTLFIIIAIVLVAGMILFFSLKPGITPTGRVTNPSSYVEKCMKDSASEALNVLSIQGGRITPTGFILYENKKVNYLCYTNQYYTRCVNQYPLLKYDVETDITNYIKPKVQTCITELKQQLEKQGYSVEVGVLKLETNLQPKKVVIDAEMPLTVSKEESARYEKYQAIVLSPVYDQVILAQDIVNSETRVGDFDQMSYMLFNSDTSVDKDTQGENVIYILRDRPSDKRFYFAVRSYVMPPGL